MLISDYVYQELAVGSRSDLIDRLNAIADDNEEIEILPGIGQFLQIEVSRLHPVSCIFDLAVTIGINPLIRPGRFNINDHHRKLFSAKGEELLKRAAMTIPLSRIFDDIITLEPGEARGVGIAEARRRILDDPKAVQEFYGSVCSEFVENRSWPRPDQISPKWVIYRWFQAKLLMMLSVYERYPRPPAPTPRVLGRMQNTDMDTMHLAYACLLGGLASRDRPLVREFRRLRPDAPVVE